MHDERRIRAEQPGRVDALAQQSRHRGGFGIGPAALHPRSVARCLGRSTESVSPPEYGRSHALRRPGRPSSGHRRRDPADVLGRARRASTCSSTTSWSATAACPARPSRCGCRASSRRCGPATRARASTPTCSSSPTACCRPRCTRPPRSRPPGSSPRSTCRRCPGRRCAGRRARSATRRCTSTRWSASCRSASAATASRLPQRRLPRRHPGRARLHLRHLRRGDEDQLRDLPALLGVPLGRARRRRDQHPGADLQRQGRGPALPRPPQHPARRHAARTGTATLGLDAGAFRRSRCTRRRAGRPDAQPDVASRTQACPRFYWTIAEFCTDGLLPFVFADADDDRQQYTMVVHVGAALKRDGTAADDGGVAIDGADAAHLPRPRRLHRRKVTDDDRAARLGRRGHRPRHGQRVRAPAALVAARARPHHPRRPARARAPPHRHRRRPGHRRRPAQPARPRPSGSSSASCCSPSSSARSRAGTAKPLLFVVLDELNKYAPRDGDSPIKEILLDIAERGRSLGVVLIGAQQTASEVERRIIANSAIRVVGRLDPAEASRPEYGFLPAAHQKRGDDRQAGHDVRDPARDPGAAGRRVPVPGVGDPARPSAAAQPGRQPAPPPFPTTRSTASRAAPARSR